MTKSLLIKEYNGGYDCITPVVPLLNPVIVGRKKYHRTIVTCAVCGNVLHPYGDRTYCRHCRTTVNWSPTHINPANWKRKGVRVTNNHNLY